MLIYDNPIYRPECWKRTGQKKGPLKNILCRESKKIRGRSEGRIDVSLGRRGAGGQEGSHAGRAEEGAEGRRRRQMRRAQSEAAVNKKVNLSSAADDNHE